MKKHEILTLMSLALPLLLPVPAAQASPDFGDRVEHRLDRKGDRIDRRLDRRGERINRRLDRRAAWAAAHGHEALARKLDRRGDIIEDRLDRKGDRINERLDRKGERFDRWWDRRH